MSDLMTLLPIFAFMLIPLWIPIIAVAVGTLADALRPGARPAVRTARTATAAQARRSSGPVGMNCAVNAGQAS